MTTALSPVQVASRWLTLVLDDRDMAAAWALTHPKTRREVAANWVEVNRRHPTLLFADHDRVAAELAEAPSPSPFWPSFADVHLGELREQFAYVDWKRHGWGDHLRPIGPDRELAVLFDAGGRFNRPLEGGMERGTGFILEFDGGEWGLTYDQPSDNDMLERDPRAG